MAFSLILYSFPSLISDCLTLLFGFQKRPADYILSVQTRNREHAVAFVHGRVPQGLSFFSFFLFYWSVVGLQYCVSSRCSSVVVVKSPSRVRLFATLWTVASQASLSMGFSRQECWSGLLCPRIEPVSLMSLALTCRFLTTITTFHKDARLKGYSCIAGKNVNCHNHVGLQPNKILRVKIAYLIWRLFS